MLLKMSIEAPVIEILMHSALRFRQAVCGSITGEPSLIHCQTQALIDL